MEALGCHGGGLTLGGAWFSAGLMSITPIDYCDPIEAFAPWAEEFWAQLLDSPTPDNERGRYAYIAVQPYATLVSVDKRCLVNGSAVELDPFTALQHLLQQSPEPLTDCPVPFTGGAVGILGYELGRHIERAPARHPLPVGQPELAIGLYDAFFAFDRVAGKAWVIGVGGRGEETARKLLRRFVARQPLPPVTVAKLILEPELTREQYLERVTQVIEYIRAGDIFQANFTVRFMADRPESFDAFGVYRRLRGLNPAPFAAFVRVPGLIVVSASPERFISLSADGHMEARPIKGTSPRHADPVQDQASAVALKGSVKDNAENLMIVDLLRNDIGRVAAIGTVNVPTLSGLESFASVHHLVSVITGRLRPGLGPVDLLRACFPGGSITGAPKVRAMEIIDELEPSPRGAYCGSVLWIGFDGAMDSNIVIRTIVAIRRHVITQAGGGIVSDSDPQAEWDEMMTKVQPALRALAGD